MEADQPGSKCATNWQAEWSVKGLMLAIPSLPILVCAIALEVLGEHLAHVRGMTLMLIIALPIFEGVNPNSRASCNTYTGTVWPGKDALCWGMLVWVVALLWRVNGKPVGCWVVPWLAGDRGMRTYSAGSALLDLFKGSKRNWISSSTMSVWGRPDMGLDGGQDGPGSVLLATSLPGVLQYSMCRDNAPNGRSSTSTRFPVLTRCPC